MCFYCVAICKGGVIVSLYDNEDKIERYLNDLSEEYKELLLKRLLETSGTIENLNVSDLLRIDMEIKRPLMSEYRRKKRFQSVILLSGIMYALMGIMLLLFFEMTDSFRYEGMNLIALVLTFLGLLMSLYSVTLPNSKYIYRKEAYKMKEDDRAVLEYNVIRLWRELEGIASDLYIETKSVTIYSLIDRFLEDGYINKSEEEILREFLKMRNNIAHNTNNNYPLVEIKERLVATKGIIDKLRKIL